MRLSRRDDLKSYAQHLTKSHCVVRLDNNLARYSASDTNSEIDYKEPFYLRAYDLKFRSNKTFRTQQHVYIRTIQKTKLVQTIHYLLQHA